MWSRRTIVILGGAGGGPAAAARARETDEAARIVVVDPGDEASCAVPGVPYAISGEAVRPEAVLRGGAQALVDLYGIEVVRAAAVRLDAAARTLHLDGSAIEYTAFIHALGAETVPSPALPRAGNVARLRTPADREAVAAILAGGRKRVAVLGGSPTGVELADAIRRAGHEVTIVHPGDRILPGFSPMGSVRATEALRRSGVTVMTNARVTAGEGDAASLRALVLQDGRKLETDLVITAGPLRPQTDLLRAAGAELNEDGSVVIDETCGTTLAHVFACGQSVAVPHAVTAWPVWQPQAAVGARTALVAGTVAAGGHAQLEPLLNSFIVRAGDLTLARTGLTWEEAEDFAVGEVNLVSVHASSCDRYLSASEPITVDLVFHCGDGHILGAEIAGRAGVDKRADVISAAILGGLSVERLSALDLAYSPPYSTPRDVVNVAGAVAAATRAGLARPWTAEQLAAGQGQVTIVDVEPERGRAGEMLESLVIPLPELRARIGSLPHHPPLVFVSETGRLGYLAARIARMHGFKDAGFLTGGLLSWLAAGFRVKQESDHR